MASTSAAPSPLDGCDDGPVLVIGGGGLGGIAWALGLLVGLGAALPPPTGWRHVIGTSAGATVGALLMAGRLRQAVDAQHRPSIEIPVEVDLADYQEHIARLVEGAENASAARARIGRFALASRTIEPERRRAVIAARLDGVDWPLHDRLTITAVDAVTGHLVELHRDSGATLVEAVTASCAVPGVWPVETIGGRPLMDGGMRSTCNADLGPSSCPRLVLVPSRLDERMQRRLDRELTGTESMVITLDEASTEAIGANPFDPARRPWAAEAGRRQAVSLRREVATHLGV